MSIHNFVHNFPHNSDDEADPNQVVTLISKLDLTLEGRNKIGFIDNTCRRSYTNEVLGRQWERVNVVTFDRVDGSLTFNLRHKINPLTQNGSPVAEYFNKLSTLWKQFDALVQLPRCTCHAAEDFKMHNQLMKLMQFLIGLDNSYMQLRSNILSRDPLPDAKGAYVLISSEESHRAVVTGSEVGSSQRTQSSVFNSSVNNRSVTQRSQTFGNTSRPNNVPITNNNGNMRTDGGPTLVCEHCGFNGHTIDRCFKLIGYPIDFGKRNNTSNANLNIQNFNRRFINNNKYVGSSSTSTFSDEQISKLISLIKENSLNDKGKGVQANMEASQHLTYTDKNLVNVIDISYLRIRVSHPNGTEALITKVGNLIPTNFLTLYDVPVVPEYSVTLASVHKVARDNKFIVGFDESKCFLMSQDLMDVKIIGIGKQVNGLYYFDSVEGNLFKNGVASSNNTKLNWHKRLGHPSNQVLTVLRNDLFFENNNAENIPCDICQKAKQTREPFSIE
ncbi:ribonuclease H-like domain-containing protein [Tanacetum coccineum]